MNELAANIIGSIAAICMVCGYLPQAYHTIRTQETDGIAMPTFLALGLGSLFFVVQGILLGNVPLVVTNTPEGKYSLPDLKARFQYHIYEGLPPP